MFWIVTGIVVVVLVALAWYASGRSRTASRRSTETDRTANGHLAEHQIRQDTGQFPGGMGVG